MPEDYQPGDCNIGEREVSIRKKVFGFFLVLTLAFSVLCSLYSHSPAWWLALLLSSFALVVLHLEIKYRFCILFGFFNLHNFGPAGNLDEVTCKDAGRKDMKRVKNIIMRALLSATAFTALLYFCVLHYHW